MEEFESKTDDDLEKMREDTASNAYVPSSIFDRIERELERRHRKRFEDLSHVPIQIGVLNQGNNNLNFTGNVSNEGSIADKRPFWKKSENVIAIIGIIVTTALVIIGWVYFTQKSTDTVQAIAPFSRGADFLNIEMNPLTKLLAVTNESQTNTSISIYDVSFVVGDITFDKYGNEYLPDELGSNTNYSTLGFSTTTILKTGQERDFDTSVFPLIEFDSRSPTNPNLDYNNFYCFFIDAKNDNGQESFYPVITSKLRFISEFDNPRAPNSALAGGYKSGVIIENLKTQMENECQALYNSLR